MPRRRILKDRAPHLIELSLLRKTDDASMEESSDLLIIIMGDINNGAGGSD